VAEDRTTGCTSRPTATAAGANESEDLGRSGDHKPHGPRNSAPQPEPGPRGARRYDPRFVAVHGHRWTGPANRRHSPQRTNARCSAGGAPGHSHDGASDHACDDVLPQPAAGRWWLYWRVSAGTTVGVLNTTRATGSATIPQSPGPCPARRASPGRRIPRGPEATHRRGTPPTARPAARLATRPPCASGVSPRPFRPSSETDNETRGDTTAWQVAPATGRSGRRG
jgi:hypothetical protein